MGELLLGIVAYYIVDGCVGCLFMEEWESGEAGGKQRPTPGGPAEKGQQDSERIGDSHHRKADLRCTEL